MSMVCRFYISITVKEFVQECQPRVSKYKVKKEEDDKKEDGTINNPYLRPVRMPRNAIVGATVPSRRMQTIL